MKNMYYANYSLTELFGKVKYDWSSIGKSLMSLKEYFI